MVNQYGQTDIMQALLAQGTSPSPYKTGLGQAARLGGVALAEWGKRKKADESRSALADALAGMNRGALTGEGPTTDAAGRAPIADPQLLARLLSDQNTAQVGQALLGKALQPAPERKIIKGADGYSYYQDTQDRVLPGVEKQQDMNFGWRMGPNGLEPVPGGPNDPAYMAQTAPYKGSKTNVSVNNNTAAPVPEYSKAPQGFVYLRNPDGQIKIDERGLPMMAPIPGTKQERERELEEQAAQAKEDQAVQQSNIVVGDIDRILGIVETADIPVTGMGSLLSRIPGSGARDVAALLDTVKANIGFDQLNQMRASSPTGGALGNVTEKELKFLQSVAGSLEQSQSEEQFVRNANRVKEAFRYVVDRSNTTPLEQITSGSDAGNTPLRTVNDVSAAPVPEVRSFVEGATVEDLDALPDDVRNAIMQRLRGQ
jgi:hypothetical protein